MDEETVKQCDMYLPRLSKRAVEALSSEFRRAIFGLIASRGPKSFSEIMEVLQVNQGSLSRQLTKLQMGGLVSNYFRRTPSSREFSFYEATDFGKGMVNALARVLDQRYRQELGPEITLQKTSDAAGPREPPATNLLQAAVEAFTGTEGDRKIAKVVDDSSGGWRIGD